MKILLVGEYSRLHNSLKEGLIALGHRVTILGTGDSFKNYPVDIRIERKYDSGILKKWKVLLYKLFKMDLTSNAAKKDVFAHAEKLKGFDVVQLINESPFAILPEYEEEIIAFLKQNNSKMFLLSCGTDHLSVKYAYDKKFRYSIMNPLFEGKIAESSFFPMLKYLNADYKKLHDFVFDRIEGVIASDLDYHIPLENHPKYLGMIPNPINIEKLTYTPLEINGAIVIFHGINRENYYKKGNDYFEAALERIRNKYADKVEIITVESLPYKEYITKYDRAHILLDQVLGFDQGYNALEAMAKGKVVFTGAEKEFVDYYKLDTTVAVNVTPSVDQIYDALEFYILNPEKILEVSKNAREFIEKEHHYIEVAKKYLSRYSAD